MLPSLTPGVTEVIDELSSPDATFMTGYTSDLDEDIEESGTCRGKKREESNKTPEQNQRFDKKVKDSDTEEDSEREEEEYHFPQLAATNGASGVSVEETVRDSQSHLAEDEG